MAEIYGVRFRLYQLYFTLQGSRVIPPKVYGAEAAEKLFSSSYNAVVVERSELGPCASPPPPQDMIFLSFCLRHRLCHEVQPGLAQRRQMHLCLTVECITSSCIFC